MIVFVFVKILHVFVLSEVFGGITGGEKSLVMFSFAVFSKQQVAFNKCNNSWCPFTVFQIVLVSFTSW